MTVFDNARALWMWEFSQQAEKTYADAAKSARNLAGATVLVAKAMDGLNWIGSWDPGNINYAAEWKSIAASAAADGVTLVPWVVPHGQDPAGEAAAHGALGPALMIDLEPYPGFWTGPNAYIPLYLQTLRAVGVTELHVSIDPRATAIAAIGGAAVLDGVDGLHPQVYWTDFQQPALDVIPMMAQPLLTWLAGGNLPPWLVQARIFLIPLITMVAAWAGHYLLTRDPNPPLPSPLAGESAGPAVQEPGVGAPKPPAA